MIVIILIAAFIGLCVLVARASKVQCPKCQKRNCTETGRVETSRRQVLFEEEEYIRHVDNKSGLSGGLADVQAKYTPPDSVSMRKYKVPGVRIHYLSTFKCNDCGHVFTAKTYADDKPPTVR